MIFSGAILILCLDAVLHVAGLYGAVSLVGLIVVIALVSRMPADITSFIVVLVCVLLLMPARLRIGPLHALGTPGSLVGLAAFAVWFVGRFTGRGFLARGYQPLRWAFAVLGVSVFASYLALGFRAHTVAEAKAADRGILTLLSMAGMALICADGLRSRKDLNRVIEAIVGCGAVVAGLGIIQFATGLDLAARVHVPAFDYVASDYNAARSGFNRIVSTTSHPIELSVVLALLLCCALYLVFSGNPARRRWYITAAAMLGVSIPMTVSRTAVVSLVAIAVVLFPSWPSKRRRQMTVILIFGLIGMRLVIPGLIGTLRSLVFHSSNDPSLTSRTAGYDTVLPMISARPWIGRGFGTFLPEQYTYLDDQMLLSLVETGVLGVVAVGGFFGVAAWLTREARRLSLRSDDRELADVVLAALLVGFLTAFTYDEFSFPTGRTLLMVLAGIGAALWRITKSNDRITKTNDREQLDGQARFGLERAGRSAARANHRAELAGSARSSRLA